MAVLYGVNPYHHLQLVYWLTFSVRGDNKVDRGPSGQQHTLLNEHCTDIAAPSTVWQRHRQSCIVCLFTCDIRYRMSHAGFVGRPINVKMCYCVRSYFNGTASITLSVAALRCSSPPFPCHGRAELGLDSGLRIVYSSLYLP